MAYGYRRSSRRRTTNYRMPRRRPVRRARRRRNGARGRTQRVIIQVVGGPGGQVPVAVTAGKKGKRSIRARF